MGRRGAQSAVAQRGAPEAWRLATQSTVHGFAWDVRQLRFLHAGREINGALTASGDAGDGFDVGNIATDDGRVWGGRADDTNRFHVTLTADSGELPLDHIVLDQSDHHWARSVVLERMGVDGQWHTTHHFDDLRRGRNDLFLDGRPNPAPAAPSAPAASNPRRTKPAPPFAFGKFDERRILVTIAAYRDPDLPNTIADAIAQAAYPEHLRFAICHQFDEDTSALLDCWADDPRFRVDAVPYADSRGCGWARNRTFAMYDDERYLLQIDAHTRFAARWDARFIDMLEATGADRPLLTTYPSRYTIAEGGEVEYDLEAGTQQLYIDEVRADLTTLQRTRPPADLSRPGPSPTLAAGLIFTRGQFCREIDYDPQIYFAGEEISLAARAFTSGYDLMYPNETLIWHLYHHDQPKHWEDHVTHSAAHADSVERLRTLFQGDAASLGKFGLGSVRSLVEFERFAGIDLGAAPAHGDGALTITIDRSLIEPRDDYVAFLVVLLDADGKEVHREQVVAPHVLDLSCATVRLLDTPKTARSHVVLPVTRSGRVGGALRPPDREGSAVTAGDGRPVLVTGAGGFIGGHLIGSLLADGFAVRAVDIKPLGRWHQRHEDAESIVADLRLRDAAFAVMSGTQRVYNLACNMGGMGFIEGNKAACMLNVLIDTHLLEASRDEQLESFFYASTACVYPSYLQGDTDVTALKEADTYPADPEDGYGWQKLFGERLCKNYGEDYGIPVRVGRYHNVYGPLGTWDGGREKAPAAICRKVATAVLSGRHEIEIWGDGLQTRSFMYIDDGVDGTRRLSASDIDTPLNIGTSEMVTINELVDLVSSIAGVELDRRHISGAPQGVRGRNSDNAEIQAKLGWQPSISLRTGLEQTYAWIHDEVAASQR